MSRSTVVHLVDDTTAGGVMRVVGHIMTAPELSAIAQHSLRCIDRKGFDLGQIKADMIVSHLAISWRSLPMLVSLRIRHPKTMLIHVEHSYTKTFVAENVTRKGRFAALLRLAYSMFNRIVAVSDAQGQWLVESGAVKASALRVIKSCVNLSAFRALERPTGPVRVIGAIGRLDRQKGFDTLIKAFTQINDPEIALHIYGQGNQEQKLRALAAEDSRIQFRGFVDPLTALANVDAVAIPSRWEAYGLVAIEALSGGRALLVNEIDGLQDHLPYGAKAVAGTSVVNWQSAIRKLISNSTSGCQSIGDFESCFVDGWRELIPCEDL